MDGYKIRYFLSEKCLQFDPRKDFPQHNMQATSNFHPCHQLWQQIWNLKTPPKLTTFLRSICQNALSTKENLYERNIIPTPACPFCDQEADTMENLFLLCSWVNSVWTDASMKPRPSCGLLGKQGMISSSKGNP